MHEIQHISALSRQYSAMYRHFSAMRDYYSTKSDDYSALVDVDLFGMTCYEILTGKLPFEDCTNRSIQPFGSKLWCNYEKRKILKEMFIEVIVFDTKLKEEEEEPAAAQPNGIRTPKLGLDVPLLILPVESSDDEPPRKRIRSRGWSAEEIRALLESIDDATGPDWDCVSETLWEEYGFDRASTSCANLWGALLQSHMAIRDQESKTEVPRAFDLEWFEMIARGIQFSGSSQGHSGSADCDEEVVVDESESDMAEFDTHSDDGCWSGESSVESQADVRVTRILPSLEETNSKYAGTKRAAMASTVVDGAALIATIAPFVNKQIEDALEPLISALQRRQEDERMHREKMLAIEDEKLALMRQKLHFTRMGV